ncbi:MAG: hypothetical protein GWP17_03340 [Aquificales bacterium]|nr:hypothetical protein [Aquificales bacterium]
MPQKTTAASWKTKPMPETQKELPLSDIYTVQEFEQISFGFLPQNMSAEDKQRHQQHVMGTKEMNSMIRLQVKQNGGGKRP